MSVTAHLRVQAYFACTFGLYTPESWTDHEATFAFTEDSII